jgi:hypothetical protein
MAKKVRKRRMTANAVERSIGHLLVRFQGRYYFIPSGKIGAPLTDDGLNNLDSLGDEVAKIMEEKKSGLIGLEFAMEISDSNAATGMVIKSRN